MSINNSPYGPPQYFYLPPVNNAAPVSSPPSLPSPQVADTAAFTQQPPPKSTVSIEKAAKYGAGIGAGYSLVKLGLFLSKGKNRNNYKLLILKLPKSLKILAVIIGAFLGMGIRSAEGALSGALVGYFLKRSEKQG